MKWHGNQSFYRLKLLDPNAVYQFKIKENTKYGKEVTKQIRKKPVA